MARISTSSSGGNVNIQDTNGNPITSTGGSLNVNVTSSESSGTAVVTYNEITGLAINSSSTVLTYTVPPGNTLSLNRIDCSCDSIGIFIVTMNSTTTDKKRIYYTDFNLSFEYNIYITEGTVITVSATNTSLTGTGSFNATLKGTLK